MRQRQGFTLVEMLVSTALVIFIMVIMTQAFTTGMEVFRQLKTVGDMQEKLRTATIIMSKDLAAGHFGDNRKISDPLFFQNGPPPSTIGGFFRIWHGTGPLDATYAGYEGTDGDGLDSFRVTDHMLHFTIKRGGTRREDFASTQIMDPTSPILSLGDPDSRFQPPVNATFGIYNYQWYEVAYFLYNSGDVTTGANPQPRYSLIRRQRLLVPHNQNGYKGVTDINGPPPPNTPATYPVAANQLGKYSEVSCLINPANKNLIYFNDQTDVTVPQRRFGMNPAAAPTNTYGLPISQTSNPGYYPLISDVNNGGDSTKAGSDLLLTDVVSFQVMLLVNMPGNTPSKFVTDLHTLYNNPNYSALCNQYKNPNFNNPANNMPWCVFDTWSQNNDPVYFYTDPVTNQKSSYSTLWGKQWLDAKQTTANPWALPLLTGPSLQIVGLQITIRIWDPKTQLTRQITFVQNV